MPRNCQDLQGQLGGDEVERRMRMLPLRVGGEVGQKPQRRAAHGPAPRLVVVDAGHLTAALDTVSRLESAVAFHLVRREMDNTIRCVCKNLFGGSRVRGGLSLKQPGLSRRGRSVSDTSHRVESATPPKTRGPTAAGVKSATVIQQTPIDTALDWPTRWQARHRSSGWARASWRPRRRRAHRTRSVARSTCSRRPGATSSPRTTRRDSALVHRWRTHGHTLHRTALSPHPPSHTPCVTSLTSGSARPACGCLA